MDQFHGFFLTLSLSSYLSLLAGLMVVYFIPASQADFAETLLASFVGASLLLSGVMLYQWRRKAEYPYDIRKRKAVRLWLWGVPVSILLQVNLGRWGFPPLTSLLFGAGWFILLTTLTFGILPAYGGVYVEWRNLSDQFARILHAEGVTGTPFDNRDHVIPFTGAVCRTCLSPVLPDREDCWNCGRILRVNSRNLREMAADPHSRWRRESFRGKPIWDRTWGSGSLYLGTVELPSGVKAESLYSFVTEDGRWWVFAQPPLDLESGDDMVPLKKGSVRGAGRARKAADSAVTDLLTPHR